MKKLLALATAAFCVLSLGACATNNGGTSAPASGGYTFADTVKWDAEYDVVVAGFGAAGAVTAKTAAENGASVLIVEKCTEGEAGGNSKVAGQLFAYGNGNVEETKKYYQALAGDTEVPEASLDVIVNGVANMAEILVNDFGLNKDDFVDWTGFPVIGVMSPEYPEFEGSETIGLWTTHMGTSDSHLYQILKEQVVKNADKIDVWFETPATELIQDPMSGAIIGVKVTRGGQESHIRALNGVVLCTGGFEDNKEMVQHYIGLTDYAPIGGLYNTGDGIRMAQAVGADLWHMTVYEGGFGLGGVSFNVEEGQRASQIQVLSQGPLNTGALVLLGMDGDRFVNESVPVRHGHVYMNGTWHNPTYPDKMWTVYDQTQADLIAEAEAIPEQFRSQVVEASSLEELAEKTGMKADQLKATIANFNDYAKQGTDEQYHRDGETMRPFDGTKYYAFPVKAEILNTQGGPKRNENAEILDVKGNPIPHLYSAGEMGGITSEHYQGGTNLAECIIFGQIAGKNAAAAKDALPEYTLAPKVESTPTKLGEVTDLNQATSYETQDNEYIGEGTGMGGKLVVKVTMDGDQIANVEIVEHSESENISDPAIEQLPKAIVEANGTEVDTISGATVTSKAIIEAVNNALAQVK